MSRTPITKSNQQILISGFEFLPALTYNNSIEIFPPFSQLANKHYFNRGLNITILESGSIKINFDNMNLENRNIFLKDLKSFLKSSRREIIDNFLIYNNKGRI